jgi:NAD(P)-dependent dehydrogenase (short-subunit alcohol dehydrogenase family)
MPNSCQGQVALVTGASRGIGRAIALRLAAEGADVALVARDVDGVRLGRSLAATVDEVRATGRRAIAIGADLTDPDASRRAIVDQTVAELGSLDILVNNAAMSVFKNVVDWNFDKLRAMHEVNVWAPWELIQGALPGMVERDRGWIVNISSGVAEPSHARPGGAAYGGTKAMLDQMTRCLALETEGTDVVANVVSPQAASRTEFVSSLVEQSVLSQELTEPLEAMAEAVLVLATCGPSVRGLVVRDLDLLAQLERPVLDLSGLHVLDGYDAPDLPTRVHELTEEAAKPRDLRGAWGKDWGGAR